MGERRSAPRVGLTFSDPADLRLMASILARAGVTEADNWRRVILSGRVRSASRSLEHKIRSEAARGSEQWSTEQNDIESRAPMRREPFHMAPCFPEDDLFDYIGMPLPDSTGREGHPDA